MLGTSRKGHGGCAVNVSRSRCACTREGVRSAVADEEGEGLPVHKQSYPRGVSLKQAERGRRIGIGRGGVVLVSAQAVQDQRPVSAHTHTQNQGWCTLTDALRGRGG
jgi:hypothetical protein